MYDDYFDAEAQPQSYIVQNSANWIYANTGFVNGSAVPGILGYEIDRFFPDAPYPYSIPGTYMLVSNSPFTNIEGSSGTSNSSIYQSYDPTKGTAGGWVFGAGTIDWSFALDSYVAPAGINTRAFPAPNAGAQTTTSNILNRFLIARPTGAPLNLKVVSATNNGGKLKINLAWTNGTTNQTGFDLERSSDGGATYTQITTAGANATTYSDTKAAVGTTYYYRVAAFNLGGNGNYSNVAVYDSSLTMPSGLIAKTLSGSQIGLTWNDNSSDETGFAIQRSLDGVSFSTVTTVPANSKSYTDTGLVKNTKYYYRVQSFNGLASSPYSNIASATTLKK